MPHEDPSRKPAEASGPEIDPAMALVQEFFESPGFSERLERSRVKRATESPEDRIRNSLGAMAVKMMTVLPRDIALEVFEQLYAIHDRVLEVEAERKHDHEALTKLTTEVATLRAAVGVDDPIPSDPKPGHHQLRIAPESGVSDE